MIRLAATVLLVCAPAAPARAEDKSRARELYRQGTQHYKLGEYQDALAASKEASSAPTSTTCPTRPTAPRWSRSSTDTGFGSYLGRRGPLRRRR